MSEGDRSFAFLVNPVSGGGAAPRVVVPLARRLREAGAIVEVTYTSSPADVPDPVQRAAGRGDVVVAVGGDGMLSSVAGEVAAVGGVLAVVPAGRGNDFARMVRVPTGVDAQVALLLAGEARAVDLLEVTMPGQRPVAVAGSAYAGVDARAAEIVDRSRWMPSKLQYPVAAVRALASYRPVECVLEVDGRRTEHRAATVVIANSGYYGKGMLIAPGADVADGLLDVVVIEAASRNGLIRSLPKVYGGAHVALDEVTVLRGGRVTLSGTYAGGGLVPAGADGEGLGALPPDAVAPLTVEIRPGALNLLA